MKYDKPKGQRIKSYGFLWVALLDRSSNNLWWNITKRLWEPYGTHPNCDYSSNAHCESVRAFRRMLRKHSHIKNCAVLVSSFRNHDVYSKEFSI